MLAVVGPSGSGKTTLLRLVSGLLTPSEGTVHLAGVDATRTAPERRPVAMVFQGFALFPHLDVADNLAFGLRVRKVGRAERRARVTAAAAALGLHELLHRLPGELSGGERQRVALGRALVRDPAVFCLDEPLSALDPLLRTEARELLAGLLRAQGRCALLVTHDQGEALAMGDRVAVLRDGRLEQVGTARELYERPVTAFVASFLGAPPMRLLDGHDGVAGPLRLPRPLPGPCRLGARPEHVRVTVDPAGTGRVLLVEDHGHEVHVSVEVPLAAGVAGRLVARAPVSAAPPVGAAVRLDVDPAHVHGWPA